MRSGFISGFLMILFLLMTATGALAQGTPPWSGSQSLGHDTHYPEITLNGDVTIEVLTGYTSIGTLLNSDGYTVTKTGPGLLIIMNPDYNGATSVMGGMLLIGHNNTYGGYITGFNKTKSVYVNLGATLRFEACFPFHCNRTITGGGNVEIQCINGAWLAFEADNTYAGTTTIEGESAFLIGTGGASGSITGNIINHDQLRIFRSDEYTYRGKISGTGWVQIDGQITFDGKNEYTGHTSISSGSLALGANGSIESSWNVGLDGTEVEFNISAGNQKIKHLNGVAGSKVILGARTLTIGTAGQEDGGGEFAGIITGTGNIVKTGTDCLTLTGDNEYTGTTTIAEGDMNIGNYTTTGSVAGNIIHNGRWLFFRTYNYTYSKVISGTGEVAPIGHITFNGKNTYTGSTGIRGTLVLGPDGSIENSPLIDFIEDNPKLDVSSGEKKIKELEVSRGTPNAEIKLGSQILTVEGGGEFQGVISGDGGSIIKTGANNLTLGGQNTATGTLTLQQGKLILANRWRGDFYKENGTELEIQGVVNIGVSGVGGATFKGGNIFMDLTATPTASMVIAGDMNPSGTNTLHLICRGNEDKLPLFQAKSGIETEFFTAVPLVGFLASLSTSANHAQLLLTTTKYETNTVVPMFVGLANSYTAGSAAVPIRVTGAGSDTLKQFTVDGVTATSFNPEIAKTYLIEASSPDGKLKIWKYVVVR